MKEKREHKRYAVAEEVVAVCPESYGQVVDISEGGVSIKLIDYPKSLLDDWSPILYCSSTGTMIKKLPLKLMRGEDNAFTSFSTNTVGAKFNTLSATLKEQIKQYISILTST